MRAVSWVYTWIGVVIAFLGMDYTIHGVTNTTSWASTHLRTDFATFLVLTVLITACVNQYKSTKTLHSYIKKLDFFIDERDKAIEARDEQIVELTASAAESNAMWIAEKKLREFTQVQLDILRTATHNTPQQQHPAEPEEITSEEFNRRVRAGEIDLSKVR